MALDENANLEELCPSILTICYVNLTCKSWWLPNVLLQHRLQHGWQVLSAFVGVTTLDLNAAVVIGSIEYALITVEYIRVYKEARYYRNRNQIQNQKNSQGTSLSESGRLRWLSCLFVLYLSLVISHIFSVCCYSQQASQTNHAFRRFSQFVVASFSILFSVSRGSSNYEKDLKEKIPCCWEIRYVARFVLFFFQTESIL